MLNAMIIINFFINYGVTRFLAEESRFSGLHGGDGLNRWVRPLQGGLHDFCGAWRQPSLQLSPRGGESDRPLSLWERVRVRVGNSLEWNDHSALLRLALHPKNRTLHPVQLRFLG